MLDGNSDTLFRNPNDSCGTYWYSNISRGKLEVPTGALMIVEVR